MFQGMLMEGNWQQLLHLTGSKQSALPQTTIAARTVRNVVRNQHQFLHVAARYFVIRDSGKKKNRHFHFSQTKLAAFPPSLSLSPSLAMSVWQREPHQPKTMANNLTRKQTSNEYGKTH